MTSHEVFVTGATGYMARALVPALLARGHRVRALARSASQHKVPPGALLVTGNALDAASFRDAVAPADTFIHLVGTPHPSPAKARQFQEVDLVSIEAALAAAVHARVRHLIYVSVAHPAPIMAAYIAVRERGEALVRQSRLAATILRPWYVLGPGHYWPLALLPAYWLLERIPSTRESATRLGLVTIEDITATLVRAVEERREGLRVLGVPEIRAAARTI